MFSRASPIKASVSQCKMKLWLSPEASAFHVFFYQGLLSSQQRTRQSRSSGYESGLGKRHSRPSSAGAEDHSPPGHPPGDHQSQIWKMCLHQKATFKGIKEASTQCSSFFCKSWLAPEHFPPDTLLAYLFMCMFSRSQAPWELALCVFHLCRVPSTQKRACSIISQSFRVDWIYDLRGECGLL